MTTSADGLWRRLLRRRRFRAFLQLAVLAGVAASATFLLTPSRLTPRIPGDDSLGQIATTTLRAPRDFDVRDGEATAQKRDEAARSVWPVYDFDSTAGELLRQRISSAFAQGRAAVEAWKQQNPEKAARLAERGRRRSPEQDELLRNLESQRDEFWKTLQAVIEEDDYLELARTGFDSAVEHAADPLVQVATEGYVVAERELLAADCDRGIVIRPLAAGGGRSGTPPERQIRSDDIDRIRDLAQVRSEVERTAQEKLATLPAPLRHAMAQVVRRAVRPNLAYDDAETRRRQDEKRAAVKEAVLQIRRGERILEAGESITKTHLLIFQAMRAAGRAASDEQVGWGGALFATLVCLALYVFARRNVRRFRLRTRDVVMLAAVLVLQLLAVRASFAGAEALRDLVRDKVRGPYWTWAGEALLAAVPFAAGSMLVRLVSTSEAALIWTAAFAPLCGVMVGGGLQPAVLALVAGVVAADRVAYARTRARLPCGTMDRLHFRLRVGVVRPLPGSHLDSRNRCDRGGRARGQRRPHAAVRALRGAGVRGDVRLRDGHPASRPGEPEPSAAQGSHRAGPGHVSPRHRDRRHGGRGGARDRSEPVARASGRVLPRHRQRQEPALLRREPEGRQPARRALARDEREDHPRLIGYFFHKAKEEAERKGEPPPAEADYRYPGPKPQTREAALVMIGDMVVATSRNVTEADAGTLRQLVDKAIQQIAGDGQLLDCDLTLRDLDAISRTFAETLHGIYSARPEAPPDARPALRVLEGVTGRVAGK